MPLPRIPETLEEQLFQKVSHWIYGYPHLDELYEVIKKLNEEQLNYVWKRLQWLSEKQLRKDDFNEPTIEEIRWIIENSKRVTFFKDAVSGVIN